MNKTRSTHTIADRIRKLRKSKNLSQVSVTQNLTFSPSEYARIEKSSTRILAEHIIELSSFFEVSTDYILKGNTRLIERSFKSGFLPLIEAKAHAGFVKTFKDRVNYDDKEWFRIPGFDPDTDQRLFEVEGESMVPTIFPGDILVGRVQPDVEKISNGTLLLLVTNKEVLCKRLATVEQGKMVLLNDNTDFPEQVIEVDLSEIQQALEVERKVTSRVIPGPQISTDEKIKKMEENIQLLQRELNSLNKAFKN